MKESANSVASRSERQLYGRRMGRPLSSGLAASLAAALPAMRLSVEDPAPAALAGLFPVPVHDVWLEIGCGGGEHLLFQAEAHRDIGFIGCEPFVSGVAKVVHGAEQAGLKNILVYDDDANHVLDWLPPASIGRAFVLFPDPWPKRRHRKRRLLNKEGIARIARVMRSDAQLYFASDIADYADMVAAEIAASAHFDLRPGELEARPGDWPLTRYAEKAIEAGRRCRFFIFTRNSHVS
jgi:tRNA (guanine-N7-)-methyltransferase